MIKRRGILLFLFLLCSGTGWLAFRCYNLEPTYQGRPLSFWLKANDLGTPAQQAASAEAICAIGPNAIPVLLEKLNAVDSPLKLRCVSCLQRQKLIRFRFATSEDHRRQAVGGFWALRPCSEKVVPMLIGIYNKTNQYRFHGDPTVVLSALGWLGTNAAAAVPLLLSEIGNTNVAVRMTAIWALRDIHGPSELVVPVLIRALADSNVEVRSQAATVLGRYGIASKEAIPVLSQIIEEEKRAAKQGYLDQHWRMSAQQALAVINDAVNPEPTVSRLIQDLDFKDWMGRIDTARRLGKFGPSALAAIPKLRQMLQEEEEALQRAPNSVDHRSMYRAVADALAEIEKETVVPR